MHKTRRLYILIGIAALILLAVLLYNIPPIHARLAWRVEEMFIQIRHLIDPPEDTLFVPTEQGQIETIVAATLQAISQTPTATSTPEGPTTTPTNTLVPLPPYVSLPGVVYVDQHYRWNYCGPSNLAMALKFWGWRGTHDDIAKVIKPGVDDPNLDFVQRGRTDLNVMPYEMAYFVEDFTEFNIAVRYGGELELIKRLLNGGFPVLIEKGQNTVDSSGVFSWMGHYLFITGYDESRSGFITQDTYPPKDVNGNNRLFTYTDVTEGWRAFNYIFLVIYPPERETEIHEILGDWGDSTWASQHALEIANQEIQTLTGLDEYFAWFSKGTSHVALQQYSDAALAYDYAFQLYNNLEEDPDHPRPYRMLYYQTGPYWAYFYSGRYGDVINLADQVLELPKTGPTLEESLYWRAWAEYQIGYIDKAIEDMKEAVRLNPNFIAGLDKLEQWGVSP